ncbi:MAG TPA: hypothetical protein VIL96_10145 [Gaiellaceae bacterium]
MSASLYVIVFAVGSAVVALWITVRFPKLMPWKMAILLVHLVLAFLCVYAVAPGMAAVAASGIPAPRLTSVFAVAFPVLVYNFLVGTWMIRLAQASGAGFRA